MKSAVKQPDIIDPKTGKPLVIEDGEAGEEAFKGGRLRDEKAEVGLALTMLCLGLLVYGWVLMVKPCW
jgi:hypothetical protein